jgi:hypothetical protein
MVKSQNDIKAKDTSINILSGNFEGIKKRIDVFNSLFEPFLTGEYYTWSESDVTKFAVNFINKVHDVGDPALDEKFTAMIDATTQTSEDTATLDFFQYLMTSINKLLDFETSGPTI